MFGRTPKVTVTKLDDAMINLLDGMYTYGSDSDEYSTLLSYLERVSILRKSEDKKRFNPDTVLLVAGNLFGILIIVVYEHKDVLTSKALGFVLKSK